jgi:copper chaperone NosL
MKLNRISTALFFLLIVIISSCANGTKEINYSKDECDYCKMQISDNRFAAETITNEGTVYIFDSIECLIGYSLVKNITENDSEKFYICDFLNPGSFIEIGNSFFVHNNDFMSPMGLNVQTFSSQSEREKFVKENGGEKINWDDVVNMVKESAE